MLYLFISLTYQMRQNYSMLLGRIVTIIVKRVGWGAGGKEHERDF